MTKNTYNSRVGQQGTKRLVKHETIGQSRMKQFPFTTYRSSGQFTDPKEKWNPPVQRLCSLFRRKHSSTQYLCDSHKYHCFTVAKTIFTSGRAQG